MGTYYITTTLPYVNAEPHIGFGLEIVAADVLARFERSLGNEVIFNTGTDEHGLKIYREADKAGKTPQAYVDEYAALFRELKPLMNLSVTHFIRTTDTHHVAAAQEFWKLCLDHGDIYKKLYQVKYCVGCELEKTESELVDGRCPLHAQKEIELIEEENYFFRFSKYQQPLLDWFASHPEFVRPDSKMKEITSFVKQGLVDFSISRLATKMPWGIPVPNDPEQVMYVWFDALINYISTLGWPTPNSDFDKYWPGVQIAGKDNLRQQSTMWQAMLMSAGIDPSEQILINGFISVDGQKMSKSMGNVISPSMMVERYGVDGTRFLLMSLGPVGSDMDVTLEQFDQSYNGFLANSLGNTVQRIAALAIKSQATFSDMGSRQRIEAIDQLIESYQFADALTAIWELIHALEQQIDAVKPWTLSGDALHAFLTEAVTQLRIISIQIEPFMPETAEKINSLFGPRALITSTPLFPRLSI